LGKGKGPPSKIPKRGKKHKTIIKISNKLFGVDEYIKLIYIIVDWCFIIVSDGKGGDEGAYDRL
jgi:hypothetical protein